MSQTPLRITIFKETNDEWYPNFKLQFENMKGLVKVDLLRFHDNSGYRVCVWGADDCGMEKDFLRKDYQAKHMPLEQASDLFYDLVDLKYVDKSTLKQLGFISA